jgi:multicomponent Na+:H+ antiporter subunit E
VTPLSVPGGRAPDVARRRPLQWPVLACLTVVWMTLWGEVSVKTAVGGLLAGAVATLVFPLPQVRLHLRVRPAALLRLIARFVADVVRSSIQVAGVVLRPRRPLRNAVVEVRLRTPSDFVMTVVAEMTCLIPGSLVVEARRFPHMLVLHVLDVGDEAGAERFRKAVLDQEERVVRALGADVAHLETPVEDAEGAR